jgi:uncharacterized protein (DUF1501 family)
MYTNRRDFLKTSLVSFGLTVPGFVTRTAWAAPTADKAGSKETILVVIQLTGGNDGLNTVIPFNDAEYGKLRPTLKIATSEVKKINDSLGLHPSLTGMADLLNNDHAMCVVQGVGYPNPNQSHFTSMDFWQSGSLDEKATEGWLGKALKGIPSAPAFHLSATNETSPLALSGAPARVPTINTLEDFQLRTSASTGSDSKDQKLVIEGSATSSGEKPGLLDFVSKTASSTYASSRRLQEIGKNYQPKVPYPQNSALANRLKLAAQLIDADLGARLFYVTHENFDTHANQANTHANLLRQLSEAVTAFYKDLDARGHGKRLLVMTFSEFGRRAKENGSKGTDHGSAAPMFLVGGGVQPGVVGDHPSLTALEMGNLKHHTDFRQVYASVLDQWLGVSSKNVLGGEFKPVDVFPRG